MRAQNLVSIFNLSLLETFEEDVYFLITFKDSVIKEWAILLAD